jgi:hypothetical protein
MAQAPSTDHWRLAEQEIGEEIERAISREMLRIQYAKWDNARNACE